MTNQSKKPGKATPAKAAAKGGKAAAAFSKPATTAKAKKKADNTPRGMKADSERRIETFCLAYHANPNGEKAAIEAGYSPKTASSQASRLLTTYKVQSRLAELAKEYEAGKIADGKERREYLTRVLRQQERDVAVGGSQYGPEYISTPAPLVERTKAAELLAKMDGDLAPVKLDVKVTEYSKDWAKKFLKLVAEYVSEAQLREIASRAPRFEP